MVAVAAITFTGDNWNEDKTITVTGIANEMDNEDKTVTISHEVSGGGYDDVAAAAVTITVTDDDALPGVPTLSVAVPNDAHDKLSASWSPPAEVNPAITGYDLQWFLGGELVDEMMLDDSVTDYDITGLSAGVLYEVKLAAINNVGVGEFATQTATTKSRNDAPSFVGDATRSVAENSVGNVGDALTATDPEGDDLTFIKSGGAREFNVAEDGQISVANGAVLDYETTASYTITVAVRDNKVNVAGVDNGDDDTDDDDTITVTINITNVAENPTLTVTGDTEVAEGDTLTLMLIATDQDDGADFTYSDNVDFGELNNNVFTWTPNFNSVGNYEIKFTVTDNTNLTATETITITVTDTPVNIIVTPATVTVDEAGGIATYDVSVSAVADGGTVTVAIASDDTITLSHSELTFDNTTPKTITVTGINDNTDNDRTTTITHTASGAGYAATATVTVTLTDDDDAGVTVTPQELTVDENGGTETYTIVLDTKPEAMVTVTPTATGDADAVVVTPTTITFTADKSRRRNALEQTANDNGYR